MNYQPNIDVNVLFFNKNHHPNEIYNNLEEIAKFLKSDGYTIKQTTKEIRVSKGSINGCKSFIDYKAPLFKNVVMFIDENTINNAEVVIIDALDK